MDSHASRTKRGTTRKLVALDGQVVRVSPESDLAVSDRDGNAVKVHLAFTSKFGPVKDSLFSIITDLIPSHSLRYVSSTSRAIRSWLEAHNDPDAPEISLTHLNTLAGTTNNFALSYRPFVLASLNRWAEAKLPGLSPEVVEFLVSGDKWEEEGNGIYFSLLTNDPCRGAFTTQELRSIHDALDLGHQRGDVVLEDYALAWMFIATGLRPVQVHRMTVADVEIHRGPEGDEVDLLVPLAKGERTVAAEKWRRRAPTVLSRCLIRYLEACVHRERDPDARLFSSGSPPELGVRLTRVLGKLETWSTRLERRVPVFPYRFRYTLGTRAIADGATDHEVARLLTHRTTHCIQYYRASMPELQKPVRELLAEPIGRIARAFKGRPIEDISSATRANDSSALLRDFLRLDGASVGACGTRVECHLHAPIACLTCPLFEPFLDAPWEQLYAEVEADSSDAEEQRIQEIHQPSLQAIREILALRDLRSLEIAQ